MGAPVLKFPVPKSPRISRARLARLKRLRVQLDAGWQSLGERLAQLSDWQASLKKLERIYEAESADIKSQLANGVDIEKWDEGEPAGDEPNARTAS